MSDGFCVETACIGEAATGLAALTADLDEVVAYVADADPDWWMWGTVGVPFSQPYSQCADKVREILGRLSPAAAGVAKRITDCADDYDQADGDTCEAFGQWDGEFGGGR
ncbi:type VII secretion target [Glycomyces buryatensis]|uniref:ESX-1 secretion-associated protein n=1 Tax=Glycomyces buryatensis TaxID=2570927 RepID=A0A4S8QDT8_9ACTN|nr:type VII secretion target [Glycomyces buryatensis]THV42480.1 hypothetical protein FAB82_06295 [Glycomyces buryatensis]